LWKKRGIRVVSKGGGGERSPTAGRIHCLEKKVLGGGCRRVTGEVLKRNSRVPAPSKIPGNTDLVLKYRLLQSPQKKGMGGTGGEAIQNNGGRKIYIGPKGKEHQWGGGGCGQR